MAKAKSKKTRAKTKGRGKTKSKVGGAAFLSGGSGKFAAGVVVGLCLIGAAIAGVAAWTPERTERPQIKSASLAIPLQPTPPAAAVAGPESPSEEEPEDEPAIDVAPAPLVPPQPIHANVDPKPTLQLPPAPTGTLPWQKFARPTPGATGPRLAIVIDDAGLDHARTARVIALNGPLTISFLTYGEGLTPQVKAASAAGHEIMVHVAMEAMKRSIDPGPDVLLRDIEPDEILARLTRVLGRVDGYVGINNHMGSLFTADRPGMELVLSEIKRRGLLFLDSRTGPHTVGADVARSIQLPYAERDVFLDNEPNVPAVNRQLQELERIAKARGQAVAIGHPHDGTIEALTHWIPDAKARGFVFVPISTIVKDNIARGALAARRP